MSIKLYTKCYLHKVFNLGNTGRRELTIFVIFSPIFDVIVGNLVISVAVFSLFFVKLCARDY